MLTISKCHSSFKLVDTQNDYISYDSAINLPSELLAGHGLTMPRVILVTIDAALYPTG